MRNNQLKNFRATNINNVKIKGLKYPRFIYKLWGNFDERKGLIVNENGRFKSEFIEGRQKVYGEYAAKIWGLTATNTQALRENKINEEAGLKNVKMKLELHENGKFTSSGNTAKDKRQNRLSENTQKTLMAAMESSEKNIALINSQIALSELQTEESLLVARRKTEKVISIYLSGAKKVLDKSIIEINIDEPSYERYQHYLTPCENERG